jgi:uncharacterized protein with NRDE domain
MCLVGFAVNASKRWPLVIASNRDEFFDRPTLPLARWQSAAGHSIVSGRDARAGGTWLGMTPSGRVAFLTNVREASLPDQPTKPAFAKSRGELVMRWLEGSMSAAQFMLDTDSTNYGGFNLVVGDWQTGQWRWISNRQFETHPDGSTAHRPKASGWCSRVLEPGVYALSNAALDTPWPKTLALKAALTGALGAADEVRLKKPLWEALANRSHASTESLPNTGVPSELEKALSSAYVDSPERGYGTRCSTVLVARPQTGEQSQMKWTLRVEEKTHLQSSDATASTRLMLQWPSTGTLP